MNFKTTILLFVVLIGIGAYVFFTRHSAPPAEPGAQPAADQGTALTDLTITGISRISVKPATGPEIVLQKTGANWQLLQPVNAPANPDTVSDLLTNLVALRSTSQLAADQKSAAGLDHPTYTVELTGAGGKVVTIAFGNPPLIAGSLDVLVSGHDDKPDVVSSTIYDQLKRTASDYRKMQLVSVSADQIQQISIIRPDAPAVHLQKSGDEWKVIAAPGPTTATAVAAGESHKADSSAVGDITMALGGLTANTFVDEPKPLEYYGLTHPALEVWFSTAPPQTQPGSSAAVHGTTVLFGRPADVTEAKPSADAAQSDVYAAIDGSIITLPGSTAQTFEKSALDLRDKTVLDIDPDSVLSIALRVDRTPEAKTLLPNKAPVYNFTLERKQESHIAGPALPTSAPATGPATHPATQPESHWDMRSGMRVTNASDTPVNALLQIFHPMTVQKYVASAATTQPASTYEITIKTNANRTETITITDPGGDHPLIGSYGDAIFELDRALLPKLQGPF